MLPVRRERRDRHPSPRYPMIRISGTAPIAAADLTGEADDEFTHEEVVLKPLQSGQKQCHHVVAGYQRNPSGYREEGSKRDRLGALSVPREPCDHGV